MAFTTTWRGTISGITDARAGMEKDSTVPLKRPNQMKCQNVTSPRKTMVASSKVAAVLRSCEVIMMAFLRMRSATTPPARENTNDGSMNDSITHVSASGELVMS